MILCRNCRSCYACVVLDVVIDLIDYVSVSHEGYGVSNGSVDSVNSYVAAVREVISRPSSCVVILCGNCGSGYACVVLDVVIDLVDYVSVSHEGYGVSNGSVDSVNSYVAAVREVISRPSSCVVILCGNCGSGYACVVLDVVIDLVDYVSVSHEGYGVSNGSVDSVNSYVAAVREVVSFPSSCVVILCGNCGSTYACVVLDGVLDLIDYVSGSHEGYCVGNGCVLTFYGEVCIIAYCVSIPREGVMLKSGHCGSEISGVDICECVSELGEVDDLLACEGVIGVVSIECSLEYFGELNVACGSFVNVCYNSSVSGLCIPTVCAHAIESRSLGDVCNGSAGCTECGVDNLAVLYELNLLEISELEACVDLVSESGVGEEHLDVIGKLFDLLDLIHHIDLCVEAEIEQAVAFIEVCESFIVERGESNIDFGMVFDDVCHLVDSLNGVIKNYLRLALTEVKLCEELVVDVLDINSLENGFELFDCELACDSICNGTDIALVELNVCDLSKSYSYSCGKLCSVNCGNVKLCKLCGSGELCVDGAILFNLEGNVFGDLGCVILQLCCVTCEYKLEAVGVDGVFDLVHKNEGSSCAACIHLGDLVEGGDSVEHCKLDVCDVEAGVAGLNGDSVKSNSLKVCVEEFERLCDENILCAFKIKHGLELCKSYILELFLNSVKLEDLLEVESFDKTLGVLLHNLINQLAHIKYGEKLIHGKLCDVYFIYKRAHVGDSIEDGFFLNYLFFEDSVDVVAADYVEDHIICDDALFIAGLDGNGVSKLFNINFYHIDDVLLDLRLCLDLFNDMGSVLGAELICHCFEVYLSEIDDVIVIEVDNKSRLAGNLIKNLGRSKTCACEYRRIKLFKVFVGNKAHKLIGCDVSRIYRSHIDLIEVDAIELDSKVDLFILGEEKIKICRKVDDAFINKSACGDVVGEDGCEVYLAEVDAVKLDSNRNLLVSEDGINVIGEIDDAFINKCICRDVIGEDGCEVDVVENDAVELDSDLCLFVSEESVEISVKVDVTCVNKRLRCYVTEVDQVFCSDLIGICIALCIHNINDVIGREGILDSLDLAVGENTCACKCVNGDVCTVNIVDLNAAEIDTAAILGIVNDQLKLAACIKNVSECFDVCCGDNARIHDLLCVYVMGINISDLNTAEIDSGHVLLNYLVELTLCIEEVCECFKISIGDNARIHDLLLVDVLGINVINVDVVEVDEIGIVVKDLFKLRVFKHVCKCVNVLVGDKALEYV